MSRTGKYLFTDFDVAFDDVSFDGRAADVTMIPERQMI